MILNTFKEKSFTVGGLQAGMSSLQVNSEELDLCASVYYTTSGLPEKQFSLHITLHVTQLYMNLLFRLSLSGSWKH